MASVAMLRVLKNRAAQSHLSIRTFTAGSVLFPEPVLHQLGEPELAMSFDLAKRDSLGHEDIDTVRENLETQGFHVQMPKNIEHLVLQAANDAQQKQE